MFISENNPTIYAFPGQMFKLTGIYSWPEQEPQSKPTNKGGPDAYETVTLTNGFYVEDEDIGSIEGVPDEPSIKYTQKKFGPNKIYYFARTGERAMINVASVPIHDHSSVVAGGPAYGTYFTDDETIPN